MKRELLIGLVGVVGITCLVIFFSWQYKMQISVLPASTISTTTQLNAEPAINSITLVELSKHAAPGNCWLLIQNNVYDLTSFIDKHPGGVKRIIPFCGKDATTAFITQGGKGEHSQTAIDELASLYNRNASKNTVR